MVPEDVVFVRREGSDQSHMVPVFRDMGDAEAAGFMGIVGCCGGHRAGAVDREGAVRERADTGKHLEQLALPVPGDSGDADDLARPDGEARGLDPIHTLGIDDCEAIDLQNRLADLRLRLVHAQQHLAADHQFGQFLGAGLCRLPVSDHFAKAHHRYAVGGGQDLAQLVGDQDDGDTALPERVQDLEQPVGFLRC